MIKRVVFIIFCIGFTFSAIAQHIDKSDLSELLKNVNTRFDEQNPLLSPNGMSLYFTRANDSLNIGGPKDKGDIWVSVLSADGTWMTPENIGKPVNNDLRNYILGFSPDGNIMFLNQEKRNPGGLIINDGIAFSVLSNGSWSKPSRVSVDYLINKSKHQSGSISSDGSLMLLSLQAYASRGEEDIYICSYQNGKWTQPVNLGSDINTSGQEMTPYLSADKRYLYFSSNGYGGKGGRDLFVSERKGESWNSWSKPKNLGSEVNSFGVELNYHIDSKNQNAYFSSTQNSDGYGDLKAHDITLEIEEEPIEDEAFEELVVLAEEARKTLRFSGI
ncbi:MAG: PD40 domain-containing protein, partial [Cyclobacteriaceae bacterium]|nr:PD40 domain-containing protein [Cyclobacteriaceae bacterium]